MFTLFRIHVTFFFRFSFSFLFRRFINYHYVRGVVNAKIGVNVQFSAQMIVANKNLAKQDSKFPRLLTSLSICKYYLVPFCLTKYCAFRQDVLFINECVFLILLGSFKNRYKQKRKFKYRYN